MLIIHKIYGRFELDELVLLELLSSKAVQRLKGIAQFGVPDQFYHLEGFSRYDHSLGVMLLLRKLGASTEEQAAGLLHDISHTAFSHVIDWLLGNRTKEDYQDQKFKDVLFNSDTKSVLEKYGLDINKIADLENFSLLEAPAPGLCADRLDYTLRELPLIMDIEEVRQMADALAAHNNKIVFTDIVMARKFADNYLKRNREHWAGFEAVSRYYQLADILKNALAGKIITEEDLWQDDKYVLDKIYAGKNQDLIFKLEIMKEKITKVRFGIKTLKKFRYIDPEIFIDGKILRLSSVDNDYDNLLIIEKSRGGLEMEI